MVNKYWNYKKSSGVGYWPRRNSPEPFHKVTHRAVGDIPGCTPAPREGTHRSEDLETIQAKLHWRIERFTRANALSIMDKQSHFSGHSFLDKGHEGLRGAYGEKL